MEEEIRREAYQLYIWRIRNNLPGTAEYDWAKAEEAVKLRHQQPSYNRG